MSADILDFPDRRPFETLDEAERRSRMGRVCSELARAVKGHLQVGERIVALTGPGVGNLLAVLAVRVRDGVVVEEHFSGGGYAERVALQARLDEAVARALARERDEEDQSEAPRAPQAPGAAPPTPA
jgi:hypothetical protein